MRPEFVPRTFSMSLLKELAQSTCPVSLFLRNLLEQSAQRISQEN
jgi:hypothetical protein